MSLPSSTLLQRLLTALPQKRPLAIAPITRHRLMSSIPNPNNKTLQKVLLKNSTIRQLENILCHSFRDRSLLARAMTHRSLINTGPYLASVHFEDENRGIIKVQQNNERLELLGDRVFALLVTNALYEQDTGFSEGQMSNISQTLVTRKKAYQYCEKLGLEKYLFHSNRLQSRKGFMYADFFEAILGALFLDGGFEAAENFFRSKVIPIWDPANFDGQLFCHKQALQEYLVSQGLPATALGSQLKYVQLKVDFHNQVFTQSIELFRRRIGMASGPTRVSADQAAARRVLTAFKKTKATCVMIRMARLANDQVALAKLQDARAAQLQATENELPCSTSSATTASQI